jgi:hypothetical protein
VFTSRRLNRSVGVKSRFVGQSDYEDACSVEDLVLQRYAGGDHGDKDLCFSEDGPDSIRSEAPPQESGRNETAGMGQWSGVHCEGRQFRELFALLMWPALFDNSVPDVFQTPFQTAPLDLDCASSLLSFEEFSRRPSDSGTDRMENPTTLCGFYASRRGLIESLLLDLQSTVCPAVMAKKVLMAWEEHKGTMVRGFDWRPNRHSPLALLQAVAVCVGGKALSGIFRALSVDYRHFSGGMPDLILFRAVRCSVDALKSQHGGAGGCEVEVVSAAEWMGESLAALADPLLRAEKRVHASHSMWSKEEDLRGPCTNDSKHQKTIERHETSASTDCGAGVVGDTGCGQDIGDEEIVVNPLWRYELRLVEVKGPSDRLSERQRAWIVVLRAAGVDCRVCRVLEQ